MNQDIRLSKALGAFSLCLGALEVFGARRLTRMLGLPVPPAVIQAFGLREMASGFTVLAHPDDARPVVLRIAGDAMDLAVLGGALMAPGNLRRPATLLATAAVLGVTLLDLGAAGALRRRSTRALSTARRTRVRPSAPTGATAWTPAAPETPQTERPL